MKEFNLYSDEEMMQEIKADNMFAFDTLYKKYSRRVFKFAVSILKSADESENIVQDVFLKLWENRHEIEKSSSVKSYVFTVTYNSAISLLRKKTSEKRFMEYLKTLQHPDHESVIPQIEYNEFSAKLVQIINALPVRQKEIYLLQREEGLKYQEIAEKLNISVNTIETHMSRALKTIRERLGNYSLVLALFYYLFV
jgi:RNA polymerase sigma-70 factor (ECF subfamily)